MSQEELINPIPIPTVYTNEQEMLNGNGGSELVTEPQLGMVVQGVQEEGQVGVIVEEPAETMVPNAPEFQDPLIFVHVPRYEWRLEVHV